MLKRSRAQYFGRSEEFKRLAAWRRVFAWLDLTDLAALWTVSRKWAKGVEMHLFQTTVVTVAGGGNSVARLFKIGWRTRLAFRLLEMCVNLRHLDVANYYYGQRNIVRINKHDADPVNEHMETCMIDTIRRNGSTLTDITVTHASLQIWRAAADHCPDLERLTSGHLRTDGETAAVEIARTLKACPRIHTLTISGLHVRNSSAVISRPVLLNITLRTHSLATMTTDYTTSVNARPFEAALTSGAGLRKIAFDAFPVEALPFLTRVGDTLEDLTLDVWCADNSQSDAESKNGGGFIKPGKRRNDRECTKEHVMACTELAAQFQHLCALRRLNLTLSLQSSDSHSSDESSDSRFGDVSSDSHSGNVSSDSHSGDDSGDVSSDSHSGDESSDSRSGDVSGIEWHLPNMTHMSLVGKGWARMPVVFAKHLQHIVTCGLDARDVRQLWVRAPCHLVQFSCYDVRDYTLAYGDDNALSTTATDNIMENLSRQPLCCSVAHGGFTGHSGIDDRRQYQKRVKQERHNSELLWHQAIAAGGTRPNLTTFCISSDEHQLSVATLRHLATLCPALLVLTRCGPHIATPADVMTLPTLWPEMRRYTFTQVATPVIASDADFFFTSASHGSRDGLYCIQNDAKNIQLECDLPWDMVARHLCSPSLTRVTLSRGRSEARDLKSVFTAWPHLQRLHLWSPLATACSDTSNRTSLQQLTLHEPTTALLSALLPHCVTVTHLKLTSAAPDALRSLFACAGALTRLCKLDLFYAAHVICILPPPPPPPYQTLRIIQRLANAFPKLCQLTFAHSNRGDDALQDQAILSELDTGPDGFRRNLRIIREHWSS